MRTFDRKIVRESIEDLRDAKKKKRHILLFKKGDDKIGVRYRISMIILTKKDVHLRVVNLQGEEKTVGGGTFFQVI